MNNKELSYRAVFYSLIIIAVIVIIAVCTSCNTTCCIDRVSNYSGNFQTKQSKIETRYKKNKCYPNRVDWISISENPYKDTH
jgi:hypothetical protein